MNGIRLQCENPITDAFPGTDSPRNPIISSFLLGTPSLLRLKAPSPARLLDCCFQNESIGFSAGSDGCIRRYDLDSGTNDVMGSHEDIATCVGYSGETCQVISASLDKNIMFWDMRSAKPQANMRNLSAEVESMSISAFDLIVAVRASVHINDMRNLGRPVYSKESCMDIQIKCISSFPNSKGYAIGFVDGRVELEFLDPSSLNRGESGIFFTGDNHGYIIAWNDESKRRLYELPRYPNSVASLSFNHVGELLAIASSYTYQEANEIAESGLQHPDIYTYLKNLTEKMESSDPPFSLLTNKD